MAATSRIPTLSELRASDYSYFGQLGSYLQKISPKAQSALEELAEDVTRPGGADWEGMAADAAVAQAQADLVKARTSMWSWDEVAASTQQWQEQLEAGTRSALDAVDDAEADGFEVGEDYSVTDTYDAETEEEYDERLEEAEAHAGLIGHRVSTLVANESLINGQLRAMSAGWGTLNFKEDGGGGQPGGGDPTEHNPQIVDPATDPVQEKQDGSPYDLGVTIPGTGILITGDPETGRPQLHIPGTKWNGDNPLPTPEGYRPLPTGTAVGPNGQLYAFYSIKKYGKSTDPQSFIGPDSHVQNLADPAHDLGPLKGFDLSGNSVGISQASGVYDPKTQRMMIVGNIGPDGKRALWQSDPIKPTDLPNAWMNNMHEVNAFNNLGPGNRENQIIALPKGGYLLTSANDVNTPGGPPPPPVVGVTAATPDGLLTATPHNLTPPTISAPPNAPPAPYGPTVTDVKILPNGQEQVTMRVSTWPFPQGWQPPPDGSGPPYHPRTYTTTFDIDP
jgi:hypothetical protein